MLKYLNSLFLLGFAITGADSVADTGFLLGSPAGHFYQVDQHRVHLDCSGRGDVTVIADSGIGGSSVEWSLVRELLNKDQLRFCSYDRAGYGWSDPGFSERTTKNITLELYKLLEAAGEESPYILIGHSFGGFTVRYFAHQYPADVTALVLVDSSHPDQVRLMDQLVTGTEKRTRGHNPLQMPAKDYIDKLPEPMRLQAGFLNSRRKAIFAQMDEIKYFQTSAEQVREAMPLPDVPVVVITHGKKVWPLDTEGQQMEAIWTRLQKSLVKLTTQGEHIIASESGHNVHIDQPELIASSIERLIK